MHDDAARQAADGAKRAKVQRAADEAQPHLLDLQQSSGNQAVSRLVQRAPHHHSLGAASTDAPGAKPQERKALGEFKGRVIKNDIISGKTNITIGGGAKQGIQPGMKGWLVNEGGHRYISFEVDTVRPGDRVSTAFVETTLDVVHQYPLVEIDRDSMPAVEDQQF
jgi:hypothetical protein